MEFLDVGIDSWIIQDGNYDNFSVGQEAQFALEFFPHSLKSSASEVSSVVHAKGGRYQICGQVIFCTKEVLVLDMGFLAYQEDPKDILQKDSWIEAEIYLGVDHFAYFEALKKIPGIPPLTYNFAIREIFLETTPWLTTLDASGRTMMVRDEQNESYKEVSQTEAWKDDEGNAHYILRCVSTDGRI